ncbi:NS7a [plateatu pika coronavirus P83]|nr:NS7a [plateatu pika coronavirus P83]
MLLFHPVVLSLILKQIVVLVSVICFFEGTLRFNTVHRSTFANCFYNWEDWFGCVNLQECSLIRPILGSFKPNTTSELFQSCNGVQFSDFDFCVSGFILRYGAVYAPDGTNISYKPRPNECFGFSRVFNSVIWYITSHVSDETSCSSLVNINPHVPKFIS